MLKKHYLIALVSILLIPVVTVVAGIVTNSIDPEIARGYSNYERNFWLLNQVKALCMFAALLVNMALWFLSCFFLVKSKNQSYRWLLLAMLGPFGLIILTMLRDNSPTIEDFYQPFVSKLKIYLRVALELSLFIVMVVCAYQVVVLKRDLMIMYQAATSGLSTAYIIDQQNASSGMWAFSEGLEVLYLLALFYLLWPLCCNIVIAPLAKIRLQGNKQL